jgi:hypothetical protein
MATDAAGIALISAGAALLGAAVGAVAGGLVDLWVRERTARQRAGVGARLIQADLSAAAMRLAQAEEKKQWLRNWNVNVDSWEEYRDALAFRLSPEAWERLSHAIEQLSAVQLGVDLTEWTGVQSNLGEGALSALSSIRRASTEAYNALADLAETRRQDELWPIKDRASGVAPSEVPDAVSQANSDNEPLGTPETP